MKRKNLLRAVLGSALLLSPVAALAGIDNTHHDIPYLVPAVKEKCSYCHSVNLTPAMIAKADAGLKKVGSFCVLVCHLDGSGPSTARPQVVPTSPGTYGAWVPAASPAAVGTVGYGHDGTLTMSTLDNTASTKILSQGHGMDKSMPWLPAGEVTSITGTAWPYTNGTDLQCTTCHAIHDGENPPFLNAQLDGFCVRCHSDAGRVQAFGTPGNHPVTITGTPMVWNQSTGAANAHTRGRDLGELATMPTNINVTIPGVANNAAKTVIAGTGVSWAMGGHLINPASGLPTDTLLATNNVNCVTCHQVHDATGGATGANGDVLTVGNDMTTVCFGCHTIEPGRTGRGHPIFTEVPVTDTHAGWQADLATKLSAGYNTVAATLYGPDASHSPNCVTCHDVHNAAANRMAIRVIGGVATYAATDSVCDTCHQGSFSDPNSGNDKHHPGVATVAQGTIYTTNNYPPSVSWATIDGNGNLADGLSCQDCHVGDGNGSKRSTAHNW